MHVWNRTRLQPRDMISQELPTASSARKYLGSGGVGNLLHAYQDYQVQGKFGSLYMVPCFLPYFNRALHRAT